MTLKYRVKYFFKNSANCARYTYWPVIVTTCLCTFFLKIGITLDNFQSEGIKFFSSISVNKCAICLDRDELVFFQNNIGTPSAPNETLGRISLMAFVIIFSEIIGILSDESSTLGA